MIINQEGDFVMALVKCPECGKENVSDSAVSCPNCGYNIKEHYEKIRHEEQERLKQERIKAMPKAQQPNLNYCPECKKEFPGDLRICPNCGFSLDDKENVLRLNTMTILEAQANSKSWWQRNTGYAILFAIFAIIFFVFYGLGMSGLFLVIGLFFTFATVLLIAIIFSDYSSKEKAKEELELAKKDYDKYKAQKDKEREAAKRQSAIDNAKKAANHPKCPNCGSTNTVRITTANRMASVAAVGIASGKIGKQYECKNCKYKW